MKKLLLVLISLSLLTSCYKEDMYLPDTKQVTDNLKINQNVGIKLETPFVLNAVKMNVKIETAGTYNVKIIDIANKVVSKEEIKLTEGDNIVTINTGLIPPSAYRLVLSTQTNTILGITDFNKL